MYLAHAGHQHMEANISKAYDQQFVIGACIACVIVVVAAALVIMSLLVKRQQQKTPADKAK